jgi:uncharacterized membrane-anchored protein
MMAPFLKLPIRHRSRPEDLPGVIGAARLDRQTKNLTKRLRTGEIAIIDHADLDLLGAEALLRQQVAAVVNVAPSISGRYPNLGPQLLVEAGVPLVDDVGPDVFTKAPWSGCRVTRCTSATRSWPRDGCRRPGWWPRR